MKWSGTRLLLFLLVFGTFTPLAAQQHRLQDSIYVFQQLDLAEELFGQDRSVEAVKVCEAAAAYSREKKILQGVAYSFIELAEIFLDLNQLDKAGIYPPKIRLTGVQLKDSLIIAISYLLEGQVLLYSGKNKEAIAAIENSVLLHFRKNPGTYAALAFNDLGYAYGIEGDLTSKAANLLEAIRIYELADSTNYGERAISLNNLSMVYYEMNQLLKAIEYAKQSLVFREKSGDIGRLSLGCCNISQFYLEIDKTQAIKYQQLCVQYAIESGDSSRMLHSYITSALVLSSQDSIEAAIAYEKKAIQLLEQSRKDPGMLARRYIAIGILEAKLKRDSVTIVGYFLKALKQSELIREKFNLRDVHLHLANFFETKADYEKSILHFRQYILYRDSLSNSTTQSTIAELEKKYQTEKKDNEIARLISSDRIQQLQIEKQESLLAGNKLEADKKQAEIELLMRSRQLQELRIARQDDQLERQLLQAKSDEQQLELAEKEKLLQDRILKNTMLGRNFLLLGVFLLGLATYFIFNRYQLKQTIREQRRLLEMRNNIAKDLHDEIGSTLTSIKILSEVSSKSLMEDQSATSRFLNKITEQSASVQQGISDIVWSIQPENDKLENMVIRMREYAAYTLEPLQINSTILVEEAVLNNLLQMNERRELLLLYKEAINNIAKYANATMVVVNVERIGNSLLLEIKDDGIGFDPEKERSSSGLKNMRKRAVELNGSFEIESSTGNGTVIRIQLPLTT